MDDNAKREQFMREEFDREHPDPKAFRLRGQALESLDIISSEYPSLTVLERKIRVYIEALEAALKVVNAASRGDTLAGSEYFDTPGEIGGTMRAIRSWIHSSKFNWNAFKEERMKNIKPKKIVLAVDFWGGEVAAFHGAYDSLEAGVEAILSDPELIDLYTIEHDQGVHTKFREMNNFSGSFANYVADREHNHHFKLTPTAKANAIGYYSVTFIFLAEYLVKGQ